MMSPFIRIQRNRQKQSDFSKVTLHKSDSGTTSHHLKHIFKSPGLHLYSDILAFASASVFSLETIIFLAKASLAKVFLDKWFCSVVFVRRWRRRPSPPPLQIRKIATFCCEWDRNTHKCPQMRKSDEAWESVVWFLTELPTSICKYWLMDGLPMVAVSHLKSKPVVAQGGS